MPRPATNKLHRLKVFCVLFVRVNVAYIIKLFLRGQDSRTTIDNAKKAQSPAKK